MEKKSKTQTRIFTDWIRENCPRLVSALGSNIYAFALRLRRNGNDLKTIKAGFLYFEQNFDKYSIEAFHPFVQAAISRRWDSVREIEQGITRDEFAELPDSLVAGFVKNRDMPK